MDSLGAVHSPWSTPPHGTADDGIVAVMTACAGIPWYISSVGNWHRPHRSGSAATRADAWIAALAAGRAALLAGELDDVAFAVADALPLAHYHPAPEIGALDGFAVTAAMVEIYQSQTSADVAAAIAGATT